MNDQSKLVYRLQGDVRSLSRMRITNRKLLTHVQEQGLILSIELERQHGDRPFYVGPLHLDVDFYFAAKGRKLLNKIAYNDSFPHLSTRIGFIEQVGEGVIFDNSVTIVSTNCSKKYTKEREPYLTFYLTELRKKDD